MSLQPVLFEDHTCARFRPLAWSVPVPELRCGMFSLRERMGLLVPAGGALAVRPLLAPLVTDPLWRPLSGAPGATTLWLNGRLAPDFGLLRALLAAAAAGSFGLFDAAGPLALACGGEDSAQIAASWTAWSAAAGPGREDAELPAWTPPVPGSWAPEACGGGLVWRRPPRGGSPCPPELPAALGWIWDIVPRTAAALAADLAFAAGRGWRRHPCGLIAAPEAPPPVWAEPTALTAVPPTAMPGVAVRGEAGLHAGPDVDLLPGTVIDARHGPVILDRGVEVGAHVFLEGPLYLGPGCRVKAGARLHGESSFGVGNRLAGEIGESTFGDFTNKQHDGFIGHAVLGSWVNLGALTTCSDLKNNYGEVRVDLGWGQVATGLRFVGLLMGDHAKTAIGTLFNTGTTVGFAANVFGQGMPPKLVPGFSWGGRPGDPAYAADKAAATAAVVLGRRGCRFGPEHARLFAALAAL